VSFNAAAETRKDQEIERLNGECLELENEVAGLKKEVESAWRTYKSCQESHAEREDTAQEEVVQLKAHMKAAAEQFDQVRSSHASLILSLTYTLTLALMLV
jgi:predicted  nucleic acid-binding Zn-ribbon protein